MHTIAFADLLGLNCELQWTWPWRRASSHLLHTPSSLDWALEERVGFQEFAYQWYCKSHVRTGCQAAVLANVYDSPWPCEDIFSPAGVKADHKCSEASNKQTENPALYMLFRKILNTMILTHTHIYIYISHTHTYIYIYMYIYLYMCNMYIYIYIYTSKRTKQMSWEMVTFWQPLFVSLYASFVSVQIFIWWHEEVEHSILSVDCAPRCQGWPKAGDQCVAGQ